VDFELTEEQVEMRAAAVSFARKELADGLAERDKKGAFARELWKKCAEFGVQGLPFPREYGGQGADLLTTILVMEGLGHGCKDNGLLFALGAQMWSVQMPIFHFGSDAQKRKYLPKLCSGEWIGAHAMSEPDSGSDAFSLKTTATRDGDAYVLSGSKTFVTSAASADLFITFATVDKRRGFMGVTGFVVDTNTSGVSVGKPIEKRGLKTAPFAEVFFDGCRVGEESRLGGEGGGAAIFSDSMEWERAFILAGHVGAMERQLETCVAYAREREQFGRPIGKFQSVANKIVDMKMRLETSRMLLHNTARAKAAKGRAPLDAAMTKLHLSEAWVRSCLDAIQVHGGYGYTSEYEVERDLRDAVGGTLYSGTSEIQRTLIAQFLGL